MRAATRLGAASVAAACLSVAASLAHAQGVAVDSDTFAGLEARAIGPATMSGRISAVAAVAGERLTIYAGAAGGGLWKSVDGGLVFKPVFDKYNQSIGAVAVDSSNPKHVWVGTGETWVRNSVSVGDGVYRSADAGDTWTRIGLERTERVSRILVHPKDGNTVYVCAAGALFSDSDDRGVYRTTDAGKTWEKVLYVAPDVGCADLAMAPDDPGVLYAGLWQFRRLPWFFTSGGPKSGLYRSKDGGSTWQRLTRDLPEGELGRIAVSTSPAKAGLVFATIEAEQTRLYRSDDGGESWEALSHSSAVTARPFYFSRLVADPKNVDRVYKMGFSAAVSDDGGRTFGAIGASGIFGPSYHGDVHDIWVNPANPEQLVIGTDGGVYISYNRGSTFRFVGSLSVSQYYHVSYDMEWPYNVYGGLQDNSTWYGPSRRGGGIANKHWHALTGGDGFWAFPDPEDPDVVYDEYQGGNLFRVRKSSLESKDIKPTPKAGEPRYRFNWNTPIHLSPNDPRTMYYGAQFLFRTRDKGESWERISPDLTTNDPDKQKQMNSGGLTLDNSTAENHCTIFAIEESPKDAQTIWVGTDDGNVQLTRDGGKTWTNVVGNVTGVPPHTWVSSIEAGHASAGTAYVTLDGHMTGDMKAYLFVTRDFGRTWTSLATPDVAGYAHVVKEDPVNPDLLFLGTEFGLWISVDGGRQWGQFKGNLPNVAVRDLAIHPRDHDLIVATHGRGLYVVDDITPLRSLTARVVESEVAFLPSRPSPMVMPTFEFGFNGDAEFVGASPAEAGVITYYLKKRHMFGDLKLEVYDGQGARLATIDGGKRRGINRVQWPMRSRAPRNAPGAGAISSIFSLLGPRVLPGTYTVRMIKGKEAFASTLTLVAEPGSRHTDADRVAQRDAVLKLFGMVERLAHLADALAAASAQARQTAGKLPDRNRLRGRLEALATELESQRKALVSEQRGEGISGEEKLREEIGTLYGNINGYEGRPTQSQLDRMAVLGGDLDAAMAKFDATFVKDAAALNTELARQKLPPITRMGWEEWDQSRSAFSLGADDGGPLARAEGRSPMADR
ncbi:MAG: glycosyl hydrolase [Acidobacteriota bacterium]